MSYDPWQAEDPGPPDRLAFGAIFVLAIVLPPVAIITCHVLLSRNRPINISGRPALRWVLVVGYVCLVLWVLILMLMIWLLGVALRVW